MFCRFRWVQCQLGVLKRCMTAVQVRKALDDLPSSLNETYERILFKIKEDAHAAEVVRNALAWLVVGPSPLRLSEIMDGLSVDPDQQVLSRDFGPLHGPALLDALGSLVTYNEVTDVVVLSHFSVKVRLPDVTVFDSAVLIFRFGRNTYYRRPPGQVNQSIMLTSKLLTSDWLYFV